MLRRTFLATLAGRALAQGIRGCDAAEESERGSYMAGVGLDG
jgi:hypothetical protein